MSKVKVVMQELKELVLTHVRNTHLKLVKSDDNTMNLLSGVRNLLVEAGLDAHTADMIKVVIGKNGLGYEVWFSSSMHSVINYNPELKALFADPLIHPESHQYGNFVSFMIDLGGEHISRVADDLFRANGVYRHVHVKPEFIYKDSNGNVVVNPSEVEKHYLARAIMPGTTSPDGRVRSISERDIQRNPHKHIRGVRMISSMKEREKGTKVGLIAEVLIDGFTSLVQAGTPTTTFINQINELATKQVHDILKPDGNVEDYQNVFVREQDGWIAVLSPNYRSMVDTEDLTKLFDRIITLYLGMGLRCVMGE